MKVLVIDDDKFTRNIFVSTLTQENIETEVAEDGEEGMRKIREWKPDVVILDLVLPKKDGFEVLETINRTPEFKHIPVYVFSALAQEHDREEALRLGAKGYFPKEKHTVRQMMDEILSPRSEK